LTFGLCDPAEHIMLLKFLRNTYFFQSLELIIKVISVNIVHILLHKRLLIRKHSRIAKLWTISISFYQNSKKQPKKYLVRNIEHATKLCLEKHLYLCNLFAEENVSIKVKNT